MFKVEFNCPYLHHAGWNSQCVVLQLELFPTGKSLWFLYTLQDRKTTIKTAMQTTACFSHSERRSCEQQQQTRSLSYNASSAIGCKQTWSPLAKTTELLSRSSFIPNHSCKYTYWLSKQPWCRRAGTRCSGWCFLLPGGGVFYLKDSEPRFNYSFRSKHSSAWDKEKTYPAREQQPPLPKMCVDLNSES